VQHYLSLDDVTLQNAWLTIGVFDGVHRGHQAILQKLTAGAHAQAAPAVVLTFSPHPAAVLSNRPDFKCLTTPEERAELLGQFGVDVVVTESFTRELASTSAADFMGRIKQHLGLSHLLIGYDFALGHNREGNYDRLSELGRELDYRVEPLEAVTNGDEILSSSKIRRRITSGDVSGAARSLGRCYALSGPVVHGDGRGRRINIPTANLDYPLDKVIPSNGVYVCWACIGDEKHQAVINIGINPTFTPDKQIPSVEAHILDFDRDLYGQILKLEFVERLRDELRFPSVETLLVQIRQDIEDGRKILEEGN
jgi:riboflavin kinase/FMN adenylyltransferase